MDEELGIVAAHVPNLDGYAGNFYFTPEIDGDTFLWKDYSSLTYTFGNVDFGTETVC
jgi:hypothetical protein